MTNSPWLPLLALAIVVQFFVIGCAILEMVSQVVTLRRMRVLAGVVILLLCVGAAGSYARALLTPATAQPIPDCPGPPYEVCS